MGGWLGVLYKNCPLYKMNYNLFFSSVNCYCAKKKGSIYRHSHQGKVRHTTVLFSAPALARGLEGGEQPIETQEPFLTPHELSL